MTEETGELEDPTELLEAEVDGVTADTGVDCESVKLVVTVLTVVKTVVEVVPLVLITDVTGHVVRNSVVTTVVYWVLGTPGTVMVLFP